MSRRYVELCFTMDPAPIMERIGHLDPFALDQLAVFGDGDGLTVSYSVPAGSYDSIITTGINASRRFLDSLTPYNTVIPAPWRVTVLDQDMMSDGLLSSGSPEPLCATLDSVDQASGVTPYRPALKPLGDIVDRWPSPPAIDTSSLPGDPIRCDAACSHGPTCRHDWRGWFAMGGQA